MNAADVAVAPISTDSIPVEVLQIEAPLRLALEASKATEVVEAATLVAVALLAEFEGMLTVTFFG